MRTDRGWQVSFEAVLEVQARPSGVQAQGSVNCVDLELRREGWAEGEDLSVNGPQKERGTRAWDSPGRGAKEVPWERTPASQGQAKGDSALRDKIAPAEGCGLQGWMPEKPSSISPVSEK